MDLQTITGATEAQRAHTAQKAHDAAARASFAGALAKASTKSAADTPESVLNAKKAPKGEKSAPVKGHAYADVTAGPRNGMFINTSGNARDGQAFVLVKRDGKEFHIYGSGKDRVVVCLKHKDDAPKPSGTTGAASS
jgi:hypothetical protein